MRIHYFLFLSLAAATATPATAGVQVLGSSKARICYEAADSIRLMEDALEYCNDALLAGALSQQDRVATLVNRGILHMRAGDVADALADFDAAIAIDPDQPEAYLNKGWAVMRRDDDWNDAVPLFTIALEKHTARPEFAHFGRAVAYETGGLLKLAYQDLQQASSLAPHWKLPRTELTRYKVVRR